MRLAHSRIGHGRWLALGLVLLVTALAVALTARGAAPEPPPLLLIISVDGLRPDWLTADGCDHAAVTRRGQPAPGRRSGPASGTAPRFRKH